MITGEARCTVVDYPLEFKYVIVSDNNAIWESIPNRSIQNMSYYYYENIHSWNTV